jgi:MFS family permease
VEQQLPAPAAALPETRSRRTGLGRDFQYLWSASLISPLGDGALLAAVPLMAKSLTTDPRLISGVAFATTLPWLLLSLVGGAVVDRFDRRRLMIAAQITQAVLVGVLALLVTAHLTRIWMLYVLPFGVATGEVMFTSASQTVVGTMVSADNLERANGRLVVNQTVARQFAGPPLGSVLFVYALPLPFWLNTLTFSLSVAMIVRIRASATASDTKKVATGASLFANVAEGLRWLMRNRLMRTLALVAGISMFGESMAQATLVLFSSNVLHLGNLGYGVLLAAMAIGGVIGGMVSGRAVNRFGSRPVAIAAQTACSVMWLGIGLIGRNPFTVVALFILYSVGESMWVVVVQSTRQRLVPNELLGRVTGAGRMITWGSIPLGSLVGGFVATYFGLITPWIVGGGLSLLVTVVALPAMIRWDK